MVLVRFLTGGNNEGNQSSEDSAIFIRCELLCLDGFCLEGLGRIVIQAEPYLEGSI
jgi:hypothetical protein